VVMDTGPFTGHQRMSDAWLAFRDFVRNAEEVPIGMLVRGGCKNDPGDQVIAAYEAPYIDAESKAGARAFPLILPTEPDAPGAAEGKRVADSLREDDRPTLVLWAEDDPVLPFAVGERVSEQLNFPAPIPIPDASHFLQEDAGPEIGAIIADWLSE
jgi:haloalkane dehalogenase